MRRCSDSRHLFTPSAQSFVPSRWPSSPIFDRHRFLLPSFLPNLSRYGLRKALDRHAPRRAPGARVSAARWWSALYLLSRAPRAHFPCLCARSRCCNTHACPASVHGLGGRLCGCCRCARGRFRAPGDPPRPADSARRPRRASHLCMTIRTSRVVRVGVGPDQLAVSVMGMATCR